jgi:hypothetical protein
LSGALYVIGFMTLAPDIWQKMQLRETVKTFNFLK